jgi:hypothetical protein
MTNFKHAERMSRRQVAERLTDVAYALVVRSPAALQIDGQRVMVPDAEELLVQWDVGFADGRLQLQMEMSWPGSAHARGFMARTDGDERHQGAPRRVLGGALPGQDGIVLLAGAGAVEIEVRLPAAGAAPELRELLRVAAEHDVAVAITRCR